MEVGRTMSEFASEGLGEPARAANDIKELLKGLWEENRGHLEPRVAAIEDAVEAAEAGALLPDARARAIAEAHTLAGSVGTFGFQEGTDIAREVYSAFRADGELDAPTVESLKQRVARLREILFD